ncbi:MAG: Crp/Fnr family transcriptional regulator [Pseudomonadota bacterium]
MVTNCANCPLRKLNAFATIKGDELDFMQRFKVGELSIDKGTPILMQGSNSPQLYTVLKGMGIRYMVLPDGKRQVINFVLPGDFLGLQAGVMGEMKHSIDATTDMVLCVFDRSELWHLFKHQPERGFDLTWLASIQEHFLGEALASVGQMSAVQRMSWGLMRFLHRCEEIGLGDADRCRMPFTQQDLADALGLSLVHTNKTLMKLRNQQILSWSDGELHLMDRARATKLAMLDLETKSARPLI